MIVRQAFLQAPLVGEITFEAQPVFIFHFVLKHQDFSKFPIGVEVDAVEENVLVPLI